MSSAFSYNVGDMYATDSTLSGGQIGLIAGTYGDTNDADARFQSFVVTKIVNPTPTPTGAWIQRASMLTPRERFGVASVNGKIYVIGGGTPKQGPYRPKSTTG